MHKGLDISKENLDTRLAIHYATSTLRSRLRQALREFEQDLERRNVDMTADIDVYISYTRKEDNES